MSEPSAVPPTTEEYVAALVAIDDDLTDEQWTILVGQRAMPGMEMTAAECGHLLGSDSYRYGNLRYGGLGRRLAESIPGYQPPVRANGSPQYWAVLSTGHTADHGQFVWTMHSALAEAIDQTLN